MDLEMILDGTSNVFTATGAANIKNCLCTIAATRVGTVPMLRHFGTDWQWLDLPEPAAMAKYRADLIDAIEQWEPRVKVISISFKNDKSTAQNGKIIPVVRIKLREGVTL